MYSVYQNQAAAAYSSLYYSPTLKKPGLYWICPVLLSFLNLSIENFSSHFSQELWGLESWNLVHIWTMGGCIVYTRIRLLLHIHPFISSFVFLANFQTLNIFVRLFSGTVRPRRLKLGIHVYNGWMYPVYRNQAAAAYSSLYFFIFLSLQLSNITIFVTLLSGTMRPSMLKLGAHMGNGWLYHVYQNHAAAAYSSHLCFHFSFSAVFKHYNFLSHFSQELWGLEDWNLVHTWTVGRCIVYTWIRLLCLFIPLFLDFSFSNFQTLKIVVTLFSGTVRPRRLRLGAHMDNGQMYHVYGNQAAAAYFCSFISSFFFLSNFQTLKFFVTLCSGAVRPRRLKLGTHVVSGQM